MSKIQYLVIHCTATPEGREVTKKDIEQWHLIERGWSRVGYSDLIQLDGSLVGLTDYNQDDVKDPWEVTNGASGYNSNSHHFVYSGGLTKYKPDNAHYWPSKDTRTQAQLDTMELYVKFFIKRHPLIKVIGHNQIAVKDCPSFDVPNWLRSICINEINIGL